MSHRRMFRAVVVAVSFGLVLSQAPDMITPVSASAAGEAKPDKVAVRPDRVSAMSTAVLQGSRVEDESQRTPTSATYANPDGTWTIESYGGVVRSRTDNDKWVPIDPTVKKDDGSYVADATPFDVKYSDGGDTTLGTAQTTADSTVSVGWPTALPTPTADGPTLIYPDAAPDTDLVVSSNDDGFDYSMVLDHAPAADASPVEFQVPLNLKNLEPTVHSDGSIVLRDGKKIVADMTAPLMWDGQAANKDGSGTTTPVTADLEGDGDSRVLVLKPDMDYLRDPSTVYPVTIDPALVINDASDTWVQSAGVTSSQYSSPELHVGSNDGGTTVARSYLNFDLSAVTALGSGVQITAAQLNMSNFVAGSCTGSAVRMSRVTSSWTPTGITWATQPTVTSTDSSTSSAADGATGCATEGTMTFNALPILNDWVAGSANLGVQIAADNETAASGFREFRSDDYSDTSKFPQLSVTYDTTPSVPSDATIVPGLSDSGTMYSNSATPTFAVGVSDPDGGNVRGELQVLHGTTVVDDWTSGYVGSGQQVTHTESTALTNGTTYTYQWRADDGTAQSAWSPAQSFVVDTTAPAAPTVSCTSYTNGTWYATRPAATTTCTLTDTATDFAAFAVTDKTTGNPVSFPNPTGTSSSQVFNVDTNYVFNWQIKALDKAGNASVATAFTSGTGTGSIVSPAVGDRSAQTFLIGGSSNEHGSVSGSVAQSSSLQWRLTGGTTWVNMTPSTLTKATGGAYTGGVTNTGTVASSGLVVWNAAGESALTAATLPASIDIRSCIAYNLGAASVCAAPSSVTLVQHGFGGNFATDDLGPATVALSTGEFEVDASDVSVPGYDDNLSFSRTYESFDSPSTAPALPAAQKVLGPGWVANIDGSDSGASASQVIDQTSKGVIILVDPDGETFTYKKTSGTIAAHESGTYVGQGAAVGNNEILAITGTTTSNTMTLTEEDGTVTTWTGTTGSTTWTATSVVSPGSTLTTNYVYNSAGLLTAITSAPAGTTGCATSPTQGCHSLLFTYITLPGTTLTRLDHISYNAWQPAPNLTTGMPTAASTNMVSTTVAQYSYDPSSGVLLSEWDPRLNYGTGGASTVATTYTYTSGATSYLATLKAPSQDAWTFNLDGTNRLSSVTRPNPTSVGGTETWAVQYGVALSGTGTAPNTTLPDLTATATATWGEANTPTLAAAVFGPDDTSGGTNYQFADLHYFTNDGTEVNTAQWGNGHWLVDTKQYDDNGNEWWSLDAGDRAYALAYHDSPAVIHMLLGTRTTYNAAGTRVEEQLGTSHMVVLEDGTEEFGRSDTTYLYDDDDTISGDMPGKPTTFPATGHPDPNLVIRKMDSVSNSFGTVSDTHTTWYRYATLVTGDGNGWILGIPTLVSSTLGSGWSTTLTRFDTVGRTLETRTPQGYAAHKGSYNDARSTFRTYYTADASSPAADCRNQPAWAGQVCFTAPGAGASPEQLVNAYNYYLNPTATAEQATGAAATRMTVTDFDPANRPTSTTVSTTGALTETALPATNYTYYDATGSPDTTSDSTGTATTTYDSWGRTLTQTDGAGNTGTTTYDAAGRTATVNDGKGTYTYGYDGTDADGNSERRGLVTSESVTLSSGGPAVFQAAYDDFGNQDELIYPNGIRRLTNYDNSGNPNFQYYVTSDNENLIMAEYQFADIDGRVITEAPADNTTQQYIYDERDRLTQVQDTNDAGQCTTRAYGYSLDSDRTSLTTYAPGTGGACSTSSTATTVTGTFDDDDHKTDTGYNYDTMGRTTTVPAVDTANPADGPLSATYYSNDMVASLTLPSAVGGAKQQSFGLDELGRISTTSSSTGGVTLRTIQNQYSDTSDSPAWTTQQTRPDGSSPWTTTWTRNILGPDGDLALIENSDGTSEIQLTDLHGDVVSTMPNSAYTGLANYSKSTEFGTPDPSTPPLAQNYTWLGGKRRSDDTLDSLLLMGARLYNPITGRFLTRDPVPGGNDNPYTYPPDPINGFDLNGEWGFRVHLSKVFHAAAHHWRGIAEGAGIGACTFISGGACLAVTVGISASIGMVNHYGRRHESWGHVAGDVAEDAAFAGVGYGVGRTGDDYFREFGGSRLLRRSFNTYAGLAGDAWTGGRAYAERRDRR
jgi:RHS repeat-associated protein